LIGFDSTFRACDSSPLPVTLASSDVSLQNTDSNKMSGSNYLGSALKAYATYMIKELALKIHLHMKLFVMLLMCLISVLLLLL